MEKTGISNQEESRANHQDRKKHTVGDGRKQINFYSHPKVVHIKCKCT